MTGKVITNRRIDGPINLAVAVNGAIRAVTETYVQDGETKFSALVPEKSFNKGFNEVKIYVARGSGMFDLYGVTQTDK